MQSFPETFAETIKIVPQTCGFSFGPLQEAFGMPGRVPGLISIILLIWLIQFSAEFFLIPLIMVIGFIPK